MSISTLEKPYIQHILQTSVSRGGIDDISPEDVVYGEYSGDGGKEHGEYLELIYLDDDILRTFSGYVTSSHPLLGELKVLLCDDQKFYLITIVEIPYGLAFKRTDIVDIKVGSVTEGDTSHTPSCVWSMKFADGNVRVIENEYQPYFTYGNTQRPNSMTNIHVIEKAFPKDKK